MRSRHFSTLAALFLATTSVSAEELFISDGPVTVVFKADRTVFALEPVEWPRRANGITVRIVGPRPEKDNRQESAFDVLVETGKEPPVIDIAKLGELVDGFYKFEVTGTTGERVERSDKRDDGRDKPAEVDFVTFSLSGRFLVDGGSIQPFDQSIKEVSEESKPGEDVDDRDEGDKSENLRSGRDRKIDFDEQR